MVQFNRDVIDHPQVAYQSFGGTTGLLTRGVIGVPFLLTHPIILHREGMNDGWVSVASSRHGVFRGAVSADHAELIGHELSPAGDRAAVSRSVESNRDIWLADLVRHGMVRFTFDVTSETAPVWSPALPFWIVVSAGTPAQA